MKKLLTGVIVVCAVLIGLHATNVFAGSSPLTGWAWSSNIGWISFNSSNESSTVLPTPVAQYSFDADNANDSSGNARHGTLLGSPTFVAGKVGSKAAQFNGSSQYVSLPNVAPLITGLSSEITMAAWVKPDVVNKIQHIIAYDYRYRFSISATGKVYCAFNASPSGWAFCGTLGGTTLNANTWYHLAVTYQAGVGYKLYVNGVLDGSNSGQFLAPLTGGTSGPCVAYGCNGQTTNSFDGVIDDVRIYNKALTGTEILQLYNGGTIPPYGVTLATTTGAVGKLTGHAWSSNVGWISFNDADVAGCPDDASSSALDGCIPSVYVAPGNDNTGKVSGWARTISSTAAANGGGWLHLSGTNHTSPDDSGTDGVSTKGVTYNPATGAFTGFAWDSVALGWVNFNIASTTGGAPVCVGRCGGGGDAGEVITGTCRVNRSTAAQSILSDATPSFDVTGVSGGSGTYSYTWSPMGVGNSSAVGSNPYTFSYPNTTTTYNPVVTVTGSVKGTGTISCPRVSVTSTTAIDRGMKLMIMPTGVSVSGTDYIDDPNGRYKKMTVRKGEKFKLHYNVKNVGGLASYFRMKDMPYDEWDIVTPSGEFGVGEYSSISNDNLPTDVADYGTYVFTLQYATTIMDVISGNWNNGSSVTLKVTDSVIEEI